MDAGYCSPLYNTFLQLRFTEQFHLANMSPGNRGDIIRVLSEYAKVSSNAHNELILAHIMDDYAKSLLEKLYMLWRAPKYDELFGEWNLN